MEHNRFMASPVDTQQQLLAELQRAGDQPVAFSELRAAGVSFPAAVISEVALDGIWLNGCIKTAVCSAFACSSRTGG